MSELEFGEKGETPTVEVRVWLRGELVHTEFCESDEEASLVVDRWSELDGMQCEVDDLSVRHRPGEILEPDVVDQVDDGYPQEPEVHGSGATRYED